MPSNRISENQIQLLKNLNKLTKLDNLSEISESQGIDEPGKILSSFSDLNLPSDENHRKTDENNNFLVGNFNSAIDIKNKTSVPISSPQDTELDDHDKDIDLRNSIRRKPTKHLTEIPKNSNIRKAISNKYTPCYSGN